MPKWALLGAARVKVAILKVFWTHVTVSTGIRNLSETVESPESTSEFWMDSFGPTRLKESNYLCGHEFHQIMA